jgi:Arc/MetJ-type ribon-helix-helix transcriptional regulator
MKISVSLTEEDVRLLDEHARRAGLPSRSAAVHQAVRLLQQVELEVEYADAWSEWQASADREAWESSDGDGLSHASG